jgi:hypothetical protein
MKNAWILLTILALAAFPRASWAEPKAPTGLTADYNGVDTVTLDWNDTPGATEYWVFRTAHAGEAVGVADDGLLVGNTPISYDKYAYQYGAYDYYSAFALVKTRQGRWRFLATTTASSYSHVYGYIYRDYRGLSEYSFRRNFGAIPYVGYQHYAPYGTYFVLALDGQGRPGLPSAQAVAFNAAQASTRFSAPENVKVTPGPGNAYVLVSWDAVTGADLYRVLGKDSLGFDTNLPIGLHRQTVGGDTAMGAYWRYDNYEMYPVYAEYSKFQHYYGDVATNSYVVYSYYGAYAGYPLYDAYSPYGIYKIVAIKTAGDVWSPTSAESRIVPPGATDIAGYSGIQSTVGDTLTISDVSSDVNGAACTIPANAISSNTVLTISVQASGTAFDTALPLGLIKQTAPIDFDIGNATVLGGQTITVTLPVPSGKTPSAMRFYHWLNGAWTEELVGRANGITTVSVTVSSLSPFVLGDVTSGGSSAGGGGGGGGGCFLRAASRH